MKKFPATFSYQRKSKESGREWEGVEEQFSTLHAKGEKKKSVTMTTTKRQYNDIYYTSLSICRLKTSWSTPPFRGVSTIVC
jgi:hypothetical protein